MAGVRIVTADHVRFWGGVKRTCRLQCEMSAFDPKRTLRSLEALIFQAPITLCRYYFGAPRSDAGWPGNFNFLPVSVTSVPFIFRIDMSLSR
jgi:hypothetical protein